MRRSVTAFTRALTFSIVAAVAACGTAGGPEPSPTQGLSVRGDIVATVADRTRRAYPRLSRSCRAPWAGTLTLPTSRASGTLAAPGGVAGSQCAITRGATMSYALHVGARTGIELRGHRAGAGLAISVRAQCDDPSSEIVCRARGYRDTPVFRAVLDAGDYAVVVEGDPDAQRPYDLALTAYDPLAYGDPSQPRRVAHGSLLTNEDPSRGGDDGYCLDRYHVGALFYAASVPPGATLNVDATAGTSVAVDALIPARGRACGAGAAREYDAFTNSGDTEIEAVIEVTSESPFDLAVSIANAPAWSVCSAARAIGEGETLAHESTAMGRGAGFQCAGLGTGGALYYAAVVPPHAHLEIAARSVHPALTEVQLAWFDGCDAAECSGRGTNGSLVIPNDGDSARDVIIAAASIAGEPPLRFDLTSTLREAGAAP